MLINYHTHTGLCGHGTGDIKQYIEAAITAGISELGFSDHAPIPESYGESLSMKVDDAELYLHELQAKKKEYRGRIKIRAGFEVDYPFLASFDMKYLTDARIDYLTGSCHMIGGWIFDHPAYIEEYDKRDIDDIYKVYYDTILSIAESGHFNILAHFDLVKKFGFRPSADFSTIINRIAKTAAAKDLCIEINTSGLRKPVKEIYPSDDIIKLFFENNVPLTIGTDAHSPDDVDFMLKETIEKLRQFGYRKLSGFKNRRRYDIPL